MQDEPTLPELLFLFGIPVLIIGLLVFSVYYLLKYARAMFPKGGRGNAIQESLDLARESVELGRRNLEQQGEALEIGREDLKLQRETNELLREIKESLNRGRES